MLKILLMSKEECIKLRIYCLYLNSPIQESLLTQMQLLQKKEKEIKILYTQEESLINTLKIVIHTLPIFQLLSWSCAHPPTAPPGPKIGLFSLVVQLAVSIWRPSLRGIWCWFFFPPLTLENTWGHFCLLTHFYALGFFSLKLHVTTKFNICGAFFVC